MEQTTAPAGLMDSVWTIVAAATESVVQIITVDLMITLLAIAGAMIFTLSATHYTKVAAEHLWPSVTKTASGWRLFCIAAAVVIGTVAGTVVWLIEDLPWWAIPMVAVLPGVTWRYLRERLSEDRRDAFLTSTDRRYRRKETT